MYMCDRYYTVLLSSLTKVFCFSCMCVYTMRSFCWLIFCCSFVLFCHCSLWWYPVQRAELPDCTKVHSIGMKDEYEKDSKSRDYRFEEEVLEYLKAFLADNDRKIEINRKRLDLSEDNPEMEAKSQEIHELAVQVGEKVSKAETLGKWRERGFQVYFALL